MPIQAAASVSPLTSAAERLVHAVVQVKRRRLHLNASEVHGAIRAQDGWSDVTERQVRTALTKANEQLIDRDASSVSTKTWSCSVDSWTEEQLVALRSVAAIAERTQKAVVPLDVAVGSVPVIAIFTFKGTCRMRELYDDPAL